MRRAGGGALFRLLAAVALAGVGSAHAAEPPPAPILMTTTASVAGPTSGGAPMPAAPDPAALPPPRQAALETQGMTPAQETRYRALTHELRCPLCQNQSIADSDAPISADLRDQVRARLLAGASDDDIRAFVTDRFGDFALYRPRFGGVTLWLWLAPLALLLVGGGLVLSRLAGRRRSPGAPVDAPAPVEAEADAPAAESSLDPAAVQRLTRLLAEEGVARPPAPTPTPSSPAPPASA